MAVFKCKMCGGSLEVTDGTSVITCEFCGTTQTVHSFDNEKKNTYFKRAEALRFRNEFDKASGIYETIVSEFPKEAEAYWGLVLCKYGIEYVDDSKTGKKIPTCHRTLFESIYSDLDYKNVLKYADVLAKEVYEKEASEIYEIQKGILEISSKEDPYDIFICYKETDANGERTIDSSKAEEIYNLLEEAGYKVFFAKVTLEDVLGCNYEAHIFNALNTSKVMLVVTSNDEYVESTWVRNEWSRYIDLISHGDKNKTLIPCYFNMDPYDLPDEMKNLQSLNLSKIGSFQDLIRGINKIFGRNGKKEKTDTVTNSENSLANDYDLLIRKGFRFLETGDFDKANGFFDQSIGVVDKCGEGYFGQLLVGWKLSSIKSAKEIDSLDFLRNDLFRNAKKYASDKFSKELLEVECAILNNDHKKHYNTYKDKIEKSESPNEVYKSIHLLSDFIDKSIENNKMNGIKIDLFDGEIELTYYGCVRLGELLLKQTNAPEDIFKIDYALQMLTSSDISKHCDTKQIVKKLSEKKEELIKEYDSWCISKLELGELRDYPNFANQFENFKDVIWKYKQNVYIFDSFNSKDEFVTEEYNKIQEKLLNWINTNASSFFKNVPDDYDSLSEVIKAFKPISEIELVKTNLISLEERMKQLSKLSSSKRRLHGFIAFLILIGVLGLLVGLSFIFIK